MSKINDLLSDLSIIDWTKVDGSDPLEVLALSNLLKRFTRYTNNESSANPKTSFNDSELHPFKASNCASSDDFPELLDIFKPPKTISSDSSTDHLNTHKTNLFDKASDFLRFVETTFEKEGNRSSVLNWKNVVKSIKEKALIDPTVGQETYDASLLTSVEQMILAYDCFNRTLIEFISVSRTVNPTLLRHYLCDRGTRDGGINSDCHRLLISLKSRNDIVDVLNKLGHNTTNDHTIRRSLLDLYLYGFVGDITKTLPDFAQYEEYALTYALSRGSVHSITEAASLWVASGDVPKWNELKFHEYLLKYDQDDKQQID